VTMRPEARITSAIMLQSCIHLAYRSLPSDT
jgi:hypothetical protein